MRGIEVAARPQPARLQWMTASVREVIEETPRVRSLVLDVPDWPGHRAGQHVDVRLTAEDGYRAQRSYSIASAPQAAGVTLTVERIGEGEVSPYLAGEARAGDRFELRGPIGGYFVWTPALDGPLFLVAGGSGIVPLMAMLRQRAAATSPVPATLLFSSRTAGDIIYRAELERL
ncbi:MAG: FAD-binding oxidoreductase, partial [Pseudolabrys sp.]